MKKVVKLYADWCGPCKVLERMTGLPATPEDLTKFIYETD